MINLCLDGDLMEILHPNASLWRRPFVEKIRLSCDSKCDTEPVWLNGPLPVKFPEEWILVDDGISLRHYCSDECRKRGPRC